MWYNSPISVTNHSNTYLSYMTSKREIVVSKISTETPLKISSKVVGNYHYLDDHGAPILYEINGGEHIGKKLLIYNLHNSPIYSRTSISRSAIESWSAERLLLDCECTYPRLVQLRDQLLLFYRKQTNGSPITRSYFMLTSYDYGNTWQDEREIITARPGAWIYAFPLTIDIEGRPGIGIIWGQHGRQIDNVQDIYVGISSDGGRTWQPITRSVQHSNLHSNEQFEFHHSEDNHASRVWDVVVSEDGKLPWYG